MSLPLELIGLGPFKTGTCASGCCEVAAVSNGFYVVRQPNLIVRDNMDFDTCLGALYENLSEEDKELFDKDLEQILQILEDK